MIKVFVESHPKKGEDLSGLLQDALAAAITQANGFVDFEALFGIENDLLTVVTISTWETIEDWEEWSKSEFRAKLSQEMEELLLEKPKVRVLHVASILREGRRN